jgi:hypothetical protein
MAFQSILQDLVLFPIKTPPLISKSGVSVFQSFYLE